MPVSQGHQKVSLYGNGLTHYHTIPHFDALKIYSCGKHCEERRNCTFSKCFLTCMALIFHFKCTLKWHLQFVSIWTSLKFCCLLMGQVSLTVEYILKITERNVLKQRKIYCLLLFSPFALSTLFAQIMFNKVMGKG